MERLASDQSTQLGQQSCQFYMLATLNPQRNLLVLISVRGRVDPIAN